MQNALLPPGFYDLLPAAAEKEAAAVAALMAHFSNAHYMRVNAPLMEFEDTLLSGPGAALNASTFRVMDPLSQRMLGLRTDHTLQIGRIATARLGDRPRPLRLSYAGPVVSATAGAIDEARQKMQVGVELIGSLDADSDAEVITLAATALRALGIRDVSVDLLLPTLMPALGAEAGLGKEQQKALHHALDRKDEGALRALGSGGIYDIALTLLHLPREPQAALAALEKIPLPKGSLADVARLKNVLEKITPHIPAALTVDVVETRCFEYQTGLSFALYAGKAQGVLARGGRYRTQADEPATGFTFYAETLTPLLA